MASVVVELTHRLKVDREHEGRENRRETSIIKSCRRTRRLFNVSK
jgi:hypothetical protein